MGLDLYVEKPEHCARWSYGGFNRFRVRLAEAAGLGNIEEYKGYGGEKEWPPIEAQPLVSLLNHSDCDGELTAEECAAVGPALRAVVKQWPEDDYDRVAALALADGMDTAVDWGTRVIFR